MGKLIRFEMMRVLLDKLINIKKKTLKSLEINIFVFISISDANLQ